MSEQAGRSSCVFAMMSVSSVEALTLEEDSSLQAVNNATLHKEISAIFFMIVI